MSNIKRSLSEDFSTLIGDEVEPTIENEVPKYVSLLVCIGSDLNELRDEVIAPDMVNQLTAYANQLHSLATKAMKPF